MGVYRITRPDGSIEYSDVPSGPGRIEPVGSDGKRSHDHKQVKDIIKEVQKRVPKLNDYLEYLEYLRNHRPYQLDRVLNGLRKEDPQTWLKLQKFPQFRPLRETAFGLKAVEKNIGVGIGMATGRITGSVEKWLETTVKDMMKRDRYGPYADVLGSKASTLPAPKSPTYSNTRYGQYFKAEDARAMEAAKASAKAGETARAAVRSGKAITTTRMLGPLVDLGIGALDPDFFRGISAIKGIEIARKLEEKGILNDYEAYMLPRLMAAGRYDEVIAMINAGLDRAGMNQ
ncbi:MAG: hypothetical protein LBE81_12120 [Azonexus sp.]|jgi:hypothetical protein|uniref:hypothetical protein n=1 Tax=Azonexus sp. TaxID=1872668 RepID=UPI00283795D9|nr:hypothetical protein [Azonexus sp.]MDR0777365.1 hypothetical protein [Azonexus sp.]